jgi:plastocyanin
VRRIIRYAGVVGIAFALIALAGCSGAKSTSSVIANSGAPTAVSIEASSFSPADVTVKEGSTVTWTNNDITVHTVTSDNGDFDSGQIQPKAKYSFTFDKRGTYQYRCLVRPTMYARVTVVQ